MSNPGAVVRVTVTTGTEEVSVRTAPAIADSDAPPVRADHDRTPIADTPARASVTTNVMVISKSGARGSFSIIVCNYSDYLNFETTVII